MRLRVWEHDQEVEARSKCLVCAATLHLFPVWRGSSLNVRLAFS